MKVLKYSLILVVLFSMLSCNTIKIGNDIQYKTTHRKVIGSFAEHKTYVLEKDYNEIAFPNYSKPLRLTVSEYIIPFKNDSLTKETPIIKLEIADRVIVLEALDEKANESLKLYLKTNSNAGLVSSMAANFDEKTHQNLLLAKAVFLVQDSYKNYILKAYKNDSLLAEINLNEGQIISYNLASPCWKQNKHYSIDIVDFVEANNKCLNKSYKSANKADKRINYFKL